MFILAEMQDIIRIEPWKFGLDMNHVITSILNKKFANKVVHKVGLCIALYDITHVSDSYLFPGDGSSHTKVRFRFIVFHPFIDEVLVGKIRSSSPDGIRVSLGFFDDIFISPQSMQYPSRFDADEQVWVWEYETEDGKNDMFMDEGEEIRFKIVEEVFIEISPTIQSSMQGAEATVAIATSTTLADSTSQETKKESPYTIQGSISESGLGLLSWWAG